MDWARAEAWLNELIAAYVSLGWAGSFGLHLTLLPLKRRLDAGERTQDLYDAIMRCGYRHSRKHARSHENLRR